MNVLKSKWVVVDGSIFTVDLYRAETVNKIDDQPKAIAFNVGREVAEHIVNLHNNTLDVLVHRTGKIEHHF